MQNCNLNINIFHSSSLVYLYQNSWETVGKKRSLGKEGGPSEMKEIREKKGERDAGRGRGGSNRRGRGISRGREGMSLYLCRMINLTLL